MRHRQETCWVGEGRRGEGTEMEGWGGQASHDITQMALFLGPTWRGLRRALPPPALLPGSRSSDLTHSQMCSGRHHPAEQKHSGPFAEIQRTLTHPPLNEWSGQIPPLTTPKNTPTLLIPLNPTWHNLRLSRLARPPLCEQLHGTRIHRQFTSKQRFTPPSYCCVSMHSLNKDVCRLQSGPKGATLDWVAQSGCPAEGWNVVATTSSLSSSSIWIVSHWFWEHV